jgi:uncharacterized protein YegJ (DUF2314 family)
MNKLSCFFLSVCFNLLLVSCNTNSPKNAAAQQGEEVADTIVEVSNEDVEMNAIIARARQTKNIFIKAYKNPNPGQKDFLVKYPFQTDGSSHLDTEHIWLSDILTKDGKYYGIVANDPFEIKKMKLGDLVTFNMENISDWKYIDNGYLVGGESIVYFYKQMTPKEKKQFEKEAGFKIRE